MANKKRLIDANALTYEIIFVKKCLASEDKAGEWTKGYRSGLVAVLAQIDEIPTVDAVEVVRCKDCKYYMTIHCTCDGCCISDDWYCADGERKDNEKRTD